MDAKNSDFEKVNSEKSHMGKMKRNYLLGSEPFIPVNSVTDLMN